MTPLQLDEDIAAAVGRILGERAMIVEARREAIEYDAFLAGRSVTRVAGTALVDGGTVRWSFVEKVTEGPAVASAYLYDNGAREFSAYRSGLLDDLAPGLAAPQLLRATEHADGRLTIWLEELPAVRPISAADIVRAAAHLGALAGRWLSRVPHHEWLFRDWIERHGQTPAMPDGLDVVAAAKKRPEIRARLGDRLDEAEALIVGQATYRAALEQLPQTLCHHDAVAANVFPRVRDGVHETVLIDWESVGPGPVGADLASLLFSSPRRGDFSVHLLPTLMPAAIAAYEDAIATTGARVSAEALRLGVFAAISLRWTLVRDVLRVLLATSPIFRGSARHESADEALDQLVTLTGILLDAAREARAMIRGLDAA